jgi:acyl-CoA thioesterase
MADQGQVVGDDDVNMMHRLQRKPMSILQHFLNPCRSDQKLAMGVDKGRRHKLRVWSIRSQSGKW